MKKTAERILILTLFLICLIMLFLVCTPAIKAEPFIRTYDLIQDGEISKSFDGTGELKVKTIDVSDTITTDTITAAQLNIINIDITTLSGTSAILNSITVSDTADITDLTADTITANKIVSKTLNVLANIAETITINSDDGHWYNGTYYQFNYLGTMFGNDTYAYMSITIPERITTIDTLILNFTYSGVDSVSNLDNETPTFIDESCILNFTYETDTYSVTETNVIGTIDVTIKNYRYSLQLDSKYFKTGINYILMSGNNPKLNGINSSRSANPPTFTFYYKTTLDVALSSDVNDSLDLKLNISDSVVITKLSELKNDSNFASYNDTLFFQVSNSDTIYADTSITADTQMDVINDTSCFVISDTSTGVNLDNFKYNYEVKINGVWQESSQLVYYDDVRKRVVFKADILTFAPNTIKFNFWRVKK